MLLVFFLSVFLYNIFAIYVTYLLCSIWHAILENFRPGAVWALDLLLYYWLTRGKFGEAWTRWSWLELAGMCVMIAGTAVYNASIELPYFEYARESMSLARDEREIFSSDAIASSPLISKVHNTNTQALFSLRAVLLALRASCCNAERSLRCSLCLCMIHAQGARAERRLSAIQNLLLDEENAGGGGGGADGGAGSDGAHHHHELGMQGRGYGGVGSTQRPLLPASRGDAHAQLLVPTSSISQAHAQPFANAFNSSSAPSSPPKASPVTFHSGGGGKKRNFKSSRATTSTQSGSAANSNSDL